MGFMSTPQLNGGLKGGSLLAIRIGVNSTLGLTR